MRKLFWLLVVVLIVVLAVMFFSKSNDTQIVINGSVSDEGIEAGMAMVDSVEVFTLNSMPIQVKIVIRGNLADGCTELGEINQSIEENIIAIEMRTVREDAICTQTLVPFSKTIALEGVDDLKAGDYVVIVNGVEDHFTLEMDSES